jgi:murein DD-endopeptidase MepM/ murein hydrolase activator NlpD
MHQVFIHAALPLFAVLGFLVALSSAEPQPSAATTLATLDPGLPEVSAAPGLDERRLPEPPPEFGLQAFEPVTEAKPLPKLHVTEGKLSQGSTLSHAMASHGIPRDVVALVTKQMRSHFDFRRARAGHSFRLAQDDAGRVVDFRYRVSNTSSYHLRRLGDDSYEVAREEAVLVPRSARIAGVVENSLYETVTLLGENGQLARDFADVFAWDIDFERSVQPGDTFEILYERLYRTEEDGSEHYMYPGRILAARYEGTAGLHSAVYFEPEVGKGGYYRPDGTSVQGEFLMAPLRHGRISSNYSTGRRHPILKVVRPHHGIDYAAPHGTPVWAVGGGEVIYRARAGGFGNLVKVKHANGYVSYYAHLSRFAKGLEVGEHVGQKQVIGFVGSTGLSTGPHVCFRIAKNGRYVNPARLRSPVGPPVPKEMLPVFHAAADQLFGELRGETRFATES